MRRILTHTEVSEDALNTALLVCRSEAGVHALVDAGANPNGGARRGGVPEFITPLMAAADAQRVDKIHALFERGADERVKDEQGRTVLERAPHLGAYLSERARKTCRRKFLLTKWRAHVWYTRSIVFFLQKLRVQRVYKPDTVLMKRTLAEAFDEMEEVCGKIAARCVA